MEKEQAHPNIGHYLFDIYLWTCLHPNERIFELSSAYPVELLSVVRKVVSGGGAQSRTASDCRSSFSALHMFWTKHGQDALPENAVTTVYLSIIRNVLTKNHSELKDAGKWISM